MRSISALLALILAAVPAGADDAPAAEKIAALSFLAGDWQSADGGWRAHYVSPDNGVVLSYSEQREGGRVVYYEFERFAVEDGQACFFPYPGGQRAATFRMVELDAAARRAAFENPENDFPTRIVYHRVADDRLVITLSGGGPEQVFDLKRVSE